MHITTLRQIFFEQSLPAPTYKQYIIRYSYSRFASDLERIDDMLKELADR